MAANGAPSRLPAAGASRLPPAGARPAAPAPAASRLPPAGPTSSRLPNGLAPAPANGIVPTRTSSTELASSLTSRLLHLVLLSQPSSLPSYASLDSSDPSTAQYIVRLRHQQLESQRTLDAAKLEFAAELIQLVSAIPADLAAQIPRLHAAVAGVPALERQLERANANASEDAAKGVLELKAELEALRDEVGREREAREADKAAADEVRSEMDRYRAQTISMRAEADRERAAAQTTFDCTNLARSQAFEADRTKYAEEREAERKQYAEDRAAERKAFEDALADEREGRAKERQTLKASLVALEGLTPEPVSDLLEDVRQLQSAVGLSRKRPRDEGEDEADQIRDADKALVEGSQIGPRLDALKSTVDALVARPVAPVFPTTDPQHPSQLHRVLSTTSASVSTLVTQLTDLGAAQRLVQGLSTQLADLGPLRTDTNKTMSACTALADQLRPLVLLVPVLESKVAQLDAEGSDRSTIDEWLSRSLPFIKTQIEVLSADYSARTGLPPGPGLAQVFGPATPLTPPDE